MNKNIAFISEHASPLASLGGIDSGGQNVYVAELSRELVHLGYTVDIYTRHEQAELSEIVEWITGVRIIHIQAGPLETIPKEDLYSLMPAFAAGMISFILKHNLVYSLIHAHFWMSAFVAEKVKSQLNIPFVITFHALAYTRLLHQKGKDRFPAERMAVEMDMVQKADHLVAVCPQDQDDLISHYRADSSKITIIPCGFNHEEFYPVNRHLARMVLGLKTGQKILLQLGRMVERKGIDNVIQALGIMKKEGQEVPLLIVVGGDTEDPLLDRSPEMARLRGLCSELNITDHVLFTGRKNRDILKYYYNASDLFITTPWYEPFGITPLESMGCGIPVIGSNVGGIKYSVQDKETGFLVEPRDPAALASKIQYLLTRPIEHRRFSENSKVRARSLFSWVEVTRKMDQLYEHIINKPQNRNEKGLPLERIKLAFRQTAVSFIRASQQLAEPVLQAAEHMTLCLKNGKKILICGNGGSAAESQHLAAELVGRFRIARRPGLPALSLAADTSVITAWANDFSFEEIFSRQVEAFGQPGDLLICLSTSGTSANILLAIRKARDLRISTLLLTGANEHPTLADMTIKVPSLHTPCIQEIHLHIIHTLCDLVEKQLFEDPALMVSSEKVQVRKSSAITELLNPDPMIRYNSKSA